MSKFVLDCSIAISWFMLDENGKSLSILERVAETGAIVPSLWHLEIGNVLLMAERSKRITKEQRFSALYALAELPIEIDHLTLGHAWYETMSIAETNGLTLYDASYLELALRMNLSIATLDKQLKDAALKKNVNLVEL